MATAPAAGDGAADAARLEGNDRYRRGDFLGAVESYTRAIELKPTEATFFTNRAAAWTGLGRVGAAAEDCVRALELDARNERATTRLATALALAGWPSEAQAVLSSAVAGARVSSSAVTLAHGTVEAVQAAERSLMGSVGDVLGHLLRPTRDAVQLPLFRFDVLVEQGASGTASSSLPPTASSLFPRASSGSSLASSVFGSATVTPPSPTASASAARAASAAASSADAAPRHLVRALAASKELLHCGRSSLTLLVRALVLALQRKFRSALALLDEADRHGDDLARAAAVARRLRTHPQEQPAPVVEETKDDAEAEPGGHADPASSSSSSSSSSSPSSSSFSSSSSSSSLPLSSPLSCCWDGATDAHVAVLRAHVQFAAGQWSEAVAALQSLARRDPDAGALVGRLATTLKRLSAAKDAANDRYKAGDHEGAASDYASLADACREAVGYAPAVVWTNLAAAHAARGSTDAARSASLEALRASPWSSKGWQRRAACATAVGAPPSALAATLRVVQWLEPDPSANPRIGGEVATALQASGVASRVHEVKDGEDWTRRTRESAHRLVLVDYFATWCGPCRMLAPLLDRLSLQFAPVLFLKVDGDRLEELSAAAGIRAFPTIHLYLDGERLGEVRGADVAAVEAMVREGITQWVRRRGPAGAEQDEHVRRTFRAAGFDIIDEDTPAGK